MGPWIRRQVGQAVRRLATDLFGIEPRIYPHARTICEQLEDDCEVTLWSQLSWPLNQTMGHAIQVEIDAEVRR